LLGTVDPLLAGLSEEAARIVNPEYQVNPACNYYFMAISTFFISATGTVITERVVVPRLGRYEGEQKSEEMSAISAEEKRGLLWALVAGLVFTAIILLGTVPSNGFLRDPQTGGLLRSPFMSGIVALIFILGAALGIAYGLGARTVRSDSDVVRAMGKSMETLGTYLVLVFFAAQFVAFFNWTNLGRPFTRVRAGHHPFNSDVHHGIGDDQPVYGKRVRQVGDHGPGLHPDAYAVGLHAGIHAGGLPHRRQRH
jgi:aminobenzoyl-glutamate transport protein